MSAHTHDGHSHAGHSHAGSGHRHAHGLPSDPGRAFAIGILVNAVFIVAETVAGVVADSTALLADAAHNLGDVLGLVMAWGATVLARRKRTARRTYGLKRTTILAGLANAMLVLVAVGGVTWEAIRRLGTPAHVDGGVVALVATLGVLVNGGVALMFVRGRERDINVRGAFVHLVADAAVSAGVVIAGLVVLRTGWDWIDPATSLAISVVILVSTVPLFRDALDLLLDAVPQHIDPVEVEAYLAGLPNVHGVHDLHIWSMSSTETALTAHVVMPWGACPPRFLRDIEAVIEHRFGIAHTTIQIEPIVSDACRQDTAHA